MYYTHQLPPNPAFISGFFLFYLAIAVFYVVSSWKIYTKAGQPGWAAIIPIYNIYVLMKIIGRPGWWTLLFLIPYVNIAFVIVTAVDLAKSFGKSTVFAIFGLFLFSFVGYPMLAFGNAKYVGPAALSKTP